MTTLSLKTLLVPSKAVEVEYPGMPDFKIEVAFLSRETLQQIRKRATKTTFKNRQAVDELNEELFLQLYVNSCVKGWSGLKLSYLEQLAPVDLTGQDPEAVLEYSEENALYLMKNSASFDSFISEQVSDLGNFSQSK
jgi:superfamily I DNA and RNA helicase